jgi:hypothetical protein
MRLNVCPWARIIDPFSNRFRVSDLSLGVVGVLAPNFHFLAMQVSEHITGFVFTLVARTCV